jgi:hypothetical protein
MPTDIDAPLRHAAQQLIDRGGVSDVRVLHDGRTVTGIAGEGRRVYVQYGSADPLSFEGECSCGERSPCVHVAAVVMSASTHLNAAASDRGRSAVALPPPPTHGRQHDAPTQQLLRYLIEPRAQALHVGDPNRDPDPDLDGRRVRANRSLALRAENLRRKSALSALRRGVRPAHPRGAYSTPH